MRPRLAALLLGVLACGRAEPESATAVAPVPADDAAPVDETAPAPAAAPAPAKAEPAPEPISPPISPPIPPPDPWLAELLTRSENLRRVAEDPSRRPQVLVTVIRPRKGGTPEVTEHGFRVDAEYTYPASAIKTVASVAALLQLQEWRKAGYRVGLKTPVARCIGREPACEPTPDPTNLDGGVTTLGHEIRKMHLVSDNAAFNLLYDVVGHRELNERWWALGLDSLRVHHRMFARDPDAQRTTPRIQLRPAKGKVLEIPERRSDLDLPETLAPRRSIGTAHYPLGSKERIDEPLDFSAKNAISLRDFHRLILAIARPDLPDVPRLGLSKKHRAFLLQAMTEDPLASTNPKYTKPEQSWRRFKPMLIGMERVIPVSRIRYVNKAGKAYGFLVENAYVVNTETEVAVAVTAVVYVNDNGVLNDDQYQYAELSRPFLRDLGEQLAREVLAPQ